MTGASVTCPYSSANRTTVFNGTTAAGGQEFSLGANECGQIEAIGYCGSCKPGCSTIPPPATPQYHCARCSTVNGCEWTEFQSYNADCSTVDSAITRTTNCNCPAISGKDNSRCAVCPANCKDISGPAEVVVGNTYTYSATFEKGYGGFAPLTDCALAVLEKDNCPSDTYYYWSKGGCEPGTKTYTWTPDTAGDFIMECRAWNDGKGECRGKCVTTPPVYACAGPGAYKTIHVVLPTPIPTQAPPTATPIPYSCNCTQIKLYSLSWQPLSSQDISPGQTIYIAVAGSEAYPQYQFDKGRIRINESAWEPSHETTDRVPQKENEFYITYTIPPEGGRLVIEGEVHLNATIPDPEGTDWWR